MSGKRILTNSALLLAADVTERILRLVLVVYSARLLGDADYGRFAFALAFTSLFLILADGGIHQLLVREIARNPEKVGKYVRSALSIKLFLAVLAGGSIAAVVQFLGKPADVVLAVYIMAGSQIVGSFSDFFGSVFRGFQQMKYDVLGTVLGGFATVSLGLLVLFTGYDFVVLAWMYLAAQVLRLLYCAVVTHIRFAKLGLEFDLPLVKFLLAEGFPFGILYFFAIMYTYVDSVLLSVMVGDEVVGWYNAAYRMVAAMMFIPIGAMKAVFPAMSVYYKESMESFARLFERTYKVMFFLGFSIASAVFLLSDRIILLVFGPDYANAAGALKILVWSTAVIFIGTVQTHLTRSSNRQGFTAKVVAASAGLNVVLNLFLIPRYSLYGAAAATLASELFTFVLHYWYLRKNLVTPPLLRLTPKLVLINGSMAALIILLHGSNLALVIAAAAAVNLLMLFLTQYFSKEELGMIFSSLRFGKRSISPAT